MVNGTDFSDDKLSGHYVNFDSNNAERYICVLVLSLFVCFFFGFVLFLI